VVGDKGYHSNEVLTTLKGWEVRSYISEPERGRRRWKGDIETQQAVYGNRRQITSDTTRSCYGSGASWWNAALRMPMRRAECGGFICAAAKIW
jgi:hypothetical protein